MKKNISLIGMSGAGKTTTAKELGLLLSGSVIIDTDELIIEHENLTIPEIFAKFGEDFFRKLETDVIKAVYQEQNQIISLGGGAFENPENRQIIKECSFIIYLKTSPDTLFDRLKCANDRPLLNGGDLRTKIKEIIDKREVNYKKSDIIIETDNKTPHEVAFEIAEVLKNEF